MGPTLFLFALLVLSIIRRLHVVRRRPDEARHRRLQQLAQQLNLGVTPLLQGLQQTSQRQRSREQRSLERSVPVFASGAWLLAALQHWLSWDVAGVLVLLFGLCWWLSKRSRQPDGLGEGRSGSSHEEQDEEKDEEEEEEESAAEDSGDGRHLVQLFAKHMRSSVQKLAYRSRVVEELVGDLLCVFRKLLADTLYLELQPAIGVGSAFEGWSPDEDSAVYRLLVPLQPPRGYTFHLELGRAQEMPAKGSRVRVQLECTCPREQPGEKTLCLLHPAEDELPRDANLLGILCTGFYLDVQKTARWLQDLVRSAWAFVPQSRQWDMKVLPSSHSCKLQLTGRSGRSLFVEMILGVQLGNSDIFLSGQTTGAVFTPSTTWTESCAVAEGKFFRHMARQAPRDTFYLQCLQLCTRVLAGTGFSAYALKTVVMHLLNDIPLSSWSRREFLMRMQDITEYLHCCLEGKRMDHFFFGNENLPEEIILPPAFQRAEPHNLFQHLTRDPQAHAQALRDSKELQDRLTRLLFFGH